MFQDVSANHKNASGNFNSEEGGKTLILHVFHCIIYFSIHLCDYNANLLAEHEFMLLNPKDVDDITKSYLQVTLLKIRGTK